MDLSVPEAAARVNLDETSLRQALASYVRTILSGDSPYDRYIAGDRNALTAEAQSGLKIFRGKGGCVVCHLGPNLSDERFHNTGIGSGIGNNDPGRAKVTGRAEDTGAFKTPSLREVAAAAPFMHDGSLATLEEVIEHYNKGGVKNPQLDPELHELKLSDSEKRALVLFLRSLSGTVREGPWMQAYRPADYRELVPLYEQAVSASRTAGSMRDLGMFLLRNGDVHGAELWLRRALALDGLPAGREQLASALEAGGKLTEAAALYEEAAKAPELAARCLAKLGELAQARGDKAGALEFYRRALAVSKGPQLAARLNDIGLLLKDLKKYAEADSHFRRALAIQEKLLGAGHPEVAATLNNVATLSFDRDRIVEAEQLQRRSLGILESSLGKNHVRVGVSASNLADILRAKGDDVAARRYYAQALAIFDEALGPSHHWTVEARDALAGK
jgi:tetratricopeptide (TPR) repeat protein